MDFVVFQGDVILVDVVPFLDSDLIGASSSLSSDELLEVANGVILVAFHPNLLPQPIVEHHLDHLRFALSTILVQKPFANFWSENNKTLHRAMSKGAFISKYI